MNHDLTAVRSSLNVTVGPPQSLLSAFKVLPGRIGVRSGCLSLNGAKKNDFCASMANGTRRVEKKKRSTLKAQRRL